jgi:hypothetical protein
MTFMKRSLSASAGPMPLRLLLRVRPRLASGGPHRASDWHSVTASEAAGHWHHDSDRVIISTVTVMIIIGSSSCRIMMPVIILRLRQVVTVHDPSLSEAPGPGRRIILAKFKFLALGTLKVYYKLSQ